MTDQTPEHEATPADEEVSDPHADDGHDTTVEVTGSEDPATFPREYVVKLRDESAKHRQRAADRDTLAERLHVALVTATGRLDDPEALTAAIDDLLARKPHLASRRVVGDVGQGVAGIDPAVDLAGILRRHAS